MASFTPLTPEQYQSAITAGFSPTQIIQNEQTRKAQSNAPDQQGSGGLAPWLPASPSDSPIEAGAKSLVNFIPSAINTGVGIIQSTADLPSELASIPDSWHSAVAAHGGDSAATFMDFVKSIPDATLQTIEGIVPAIKPALKGDLTGVAAQIENNPVGNILPIVTAVEGGVRGLADKGVIPSSVPDALDTGISRTAQAVIKPIRTAASAVFGKIGDTARFGASQATGLNPQTLATVKENPSSFSKAAMSSTDRLSVARQVENGLQTRINDLSDTGKSYSPIRKSVAPVRVSPDFIDNLFTRNTGLSIQEAPTPKAVVSEPGVIQMEEPPEEIKPPGKLVASPGSAVRDSGDVSRLQKIYNTYQPLFQKGQMTQNEFLNLRSDLADAANYESKNGKSAPVEAAAQRMRAQLNAEYRPQIPGLQTIDDSFSGQIDELKALKQGLIDKDGNLTDAAINRIANAAGRGKDLLLQRLEQIVPGITKKIQIVSAIEDIEHTGGPKVGTYMRGGIESGGLLGTMMGHPIAGITAIVAAILTSPKMAVPILRAYGASAEVTAAVLSKLKGYLNPSMSTPTALPFMPRSNAQAVNPSPVQ